MKVILYNIKVYGAYLGVNEWKKKFKENKILNGKIE